MSNDIVALATATTYCRECDSENVSIEGNGRNCAYLECPDCGWEHTLIGTIHEIPVNCGAVIGETEIAGHELTLYCANDPVDGAERCNVHGGNTPSFDAEGVDEETIEAMKQGQKKAQKSKPFGNLEHGIYASAEIFFGEVDEYYHDLYHHFKAALCAQYEDIHNREPGEFEKAELEDIAFIMTKLRFSRQYEQEQAVDESLPLTETKVEDVGGKPVEVEVIGRVNNLKKDLRREKRLILKEMGLFDVDQDEDEIDVGELWVEDLEAEGD